MAKSVRLSNGREWPNQKAALEYFHDMLHRYQDKESIDNRQDHEDLVALLERYDLAITDGPPKAGRGIDHFERRRNVAEGWSTPGFWVIRTDDTATDFSYIAAVKGQPMSDARQFSDACRTAVQPSLLAAKKRFFDTHADTQGRVPCELTGAPLSFEEAHLDHAWPTFGQIVAMFRAARGWGHGIPAGIVTAPADAQAISAFRDVDVSQAFVNFHQGAAMLRIVAAKANLALAASQRRPKILRPVVL